MKTEQLDKLFDDWKAEIYPNSNSFIRDGIIDEEQWEKANKKILFIAKEANNNSDGDWDFRVWWKDSINFTFSYRIGEWASGLLKDFPPFDDINNNEARHDAIKKIAFMNINKTGGTSIANTVILKEHIDKSKEFILKQIEIINPEIIISCIGEYLDDYLFGNENWQKSGYAIWVKKYNETKLISFLHPSARSYSSAPYCLLKNVIETDIFKCLK